MTSNVSVAQDTTLVARASAGDRDAMADLYDRYFDRVYDFVHRMTRDADEAADVVQDVFLKAMSSMNSLKKGDRFRSWLFSIAHNTTLNRLEKQKRITRPVAGEEGEEPRIYQQVDPDRLADPEASLVDQETASLVWEAAEGLDRRQYALLDLHVRQGLDSAEIAEVLGVTKGNAYTMVSRLKSSVEESITAYLMMRRGSKDCPALNDLLGDARVGGMTPELRRLVTRHISQCSTCSENKKRIVSPLAVLGAFAMVPPPIGLKETIFQRISGPGAGPPSGDGGAGGASTQETFLQQMVGAGREAARTLTRTMMSGRQAIRSLARRRPYSMLAGAAIGIGGVGILILLTLPGAFSGDGDSAVLGALSSPTPTASATARATATPTPRATVTPTEATETPAATGSATHTPTTTSEPAPVPTPGTAGDSPEPTPPPTPGPTAPPTPAPVAPPTPAPTAPPTPAPTAPPTPAPTAPPTPAPTAPPTPAPTAPPTPTPSPVPDTTGPSITGLSASESHIWEDSLWCGSNPMIAWISAQISDPSGIHWMHLEWWVEGGTGPDTEGLKPPDAQVGSTTYWEVGPFAPDTITGSLGQATIWLWVRAMDLVGNLHTEVTTITLHDCPSE